ncbi:hypothetical protein ACI3E1_02185, partial [Ligilactobacillus sp. LYQ139]|uniref:hypothetical protein n=1 Tax=Ligilactobacillus sp. LYQ139 TaxID=3378800 RepID=UPI003854860F
LTPAVMLVIANAIHKYVPQQDVLEALEQFAKDAVVLAEKAGAPDKMQYAEVMLQDMLVRAGFDKQDTDLLRGCLEHAYCELKDDIERVYSTPKIKPAEPSGGED